MLLSHAMESNLPHATTIETGQQDFGFAACESPITKPVPGRPRVRARVRAADWEKQIARAFLYVHGRAQTPEEAAELERLYEAALAEGPDFIHCHSKSELKDAPEINLDANGITKLMVTFYTMTRNGWTGKAKGKHRGLLSRCAEDVFKALVYLAGKHRRLFPSIKGLAYLARCCPQSVHDALNQLEALGIVTRHRRLKRVTTPLGFKTVQNTNAYELHPPKTGLGKLAEAMFGVKKPANITESNNSRASASIVSFPCAPAVPKPKPDPSGEPLHVLYDRWKQREAAMR
jgi:hypothetical protein